MRTRAVAGMSNPVQVAFGLPPVQGACSVSPTRVIPPIIGGVNVGGGLAVGPGIGGPPDMVDSLSSSSGSSGKSSPSAVKEVGDSAVPANSSSASKSSCKFTTAVSSSVSSSEWYTGRSVSYNHEINERARLDGVSSAMVTVTR